MRLYLFALLSSALLAGCSSEENETSPLKLLVNRFNADETPVQPTRASIAGFRDPLLLVQLENGTSSFLVRTRTNGADRIWQSADGVSLTLTHGMLRATRGMGQDLMSASVPALSAGAAVERVHYYYDWSGETQVQRWTCSRVNLGAHTVDVLERSYRVLRTDETCNLDGKVIRNTYWRDSSGFIRQSRQWVSDGVGYATLSRVVD
ncbi:YjbF family lipoprotein [Rhodovulum imhoffii]|nr:YjbF family lipoprotein [Rhodovulum imhoffii]